MLLGLLPALICICVSATPAAAKEVRLPKPPIGAFAEPKSLAVDQGTHEVYAVDGRSEVQRIKVSATAGSFKLKFGTETTGDLSFDAKASEVRDALRTVACGGGPCLIVEGGPGDAGGSKPYVVSFAGSLETTDVEQIECLAGTPPLSGGSGCTVETTVSGVNGQIVRYQANGTPSSFEALGSNVIDGRGPGLDQTPQSSLQFGPAAEVQVAIDESTGATKGDIYVTQSRGKLVDVFAPSGKYLGQLTEFKEGPTASGPLKPLSEPCGVAVDSGGELYVGDFGSEDLIHKYDPAANPVTNADNIANFSSLAGPSSPCALAAGAGPTAAFLFASKFSGELFKLDATSGELKYKVSEGTTTVTVDPISGHVLSATENGIKEFDASGSSSATPLGSIAAGSETLGVAVDGSTGKGGTVYLSRAGVTHLDVYGPLVVVPDVETKEAGPLGGTTATLSGTISADNGAVASCHFEYLSESTFQAQKKAAEEASKVIPKTAAEIAEAAFAGAGSAPCEPAGPFSGSEINEVSGEATGLSAETEYEFRLVGENVNGQIAASPLPFETLGKPLIEGGKASQVSATTALISGKVNPRGLETEVAIEYVTEAQFEASEFAAATSVAGANVPPSPPGPQQVSVGLTGLTPDTPYLFRIVAQSSAGAGEPGKAGRFATFPPLDLSLLDERAYELVTPAQKLGEPYVPEPDRREGQGGTCGDCTPGWEKPRMPMQSSPDGNAVAYEGDPFEAGLASGANEYRSRRGAGGWQSAGLSTPSFRDGVGEGFKALSADLTKAVIVQQVRSLTPEAPEGFANLYLQEEGKAGLATLIEAEPPQRNVDNFAVTYAGANAGSEAAPSFSHVIFEANDALSAEDPGIAPEAPGVGEKETNLYEWSNGALHLVNVLPGNGEAAPDAVFGSGQLLALGGNENFNFDHAISNDGSRIFWSALPSGQVFVREGGTSTTEIPDPGRFLTATPDGSKVLLNDGMLYDLKEEALTDLSSGAGGFEGLAGKSEDLSRIYFVDTEALTPPTEENANGEAAQTGQPNLYLWEEGTLRFIATLLPSDDNISIEKLGIWHAAPGDRLAQATPDGRFLAFESRAPLTGYDSTIAAGEGCSGPHKIGIAQCFEVFEYDAQEETLICASCRASGEAPLGPSNLALIGKEEASFPQPRSLPPAGEGRLFFESQDTLTLADANGHIQDVYEWEPEGVGNCARAKGCLALISSGTSPKDSYFLDASDSGNDAFFETRAALVPQDIGGDFLDVYDARVGGGIPEVLNPPCEGQACRGAGPPAPSEPSAASALFSGPGNQGSKRCAKGRVRRGAKCVKRPRRHHSKRSAKHSQGGKR
jgi:hypothetical protein